MASRTTRHHHIPRDSSPQVADYWECRSRTHPCQKVAPEIAKLRWSGDRLGLPTPASGLMLWLAVVTVLSGVFDIKYYLHLQVRSTRSARRPIGTFSFSPHSSCHTFPPTIKCAISSDREAIGRNADLQLYDMTLLANSIVLETFDPPPRLPVLQ